MVVTFAMLFVVLIAKEYWWDIEYEQGETYLSGTLDLIEYYAGAAAAAIALTLTHRPL